MEEVAWPAAPQLAARLAWAYCYTTALPQYFCCRKGSSGLPMAYTMKPISLHTRGVGGWGVGVTGGVVGPLTLQRMAANEPCSPPPQPGRKHPAPPRRAPQLGMVQDVAAVKDEGRLDHAVVHLQPAGEGGGIRGGCLGMTPARQQPLQPFPSMRAPTGQPLLHTPSNQSTWRFSPKPI